MTLPPKALRIKHKISYHGVDYTDYYHWTRDISNPKVMEYIKAENNYTEEKIKSFKPLYDQIYTELKTRTKEDDESVPEKIDDYFYYDRTVKDKEYEIYCRKKGSLNSLEEIYLDLNQREEDYIDLGDLDISPNHNFIAYSLDFVGNENFTIFIRDLTNKEEKIFDKEKLAGSICWHNDSKGFFFDILNDVNIPAFVYYSPSIDSADKSIKIFEELDNTKSIYFYRSKDKKFLFISSDSKDSSEIYFLNLKNDINPKELHLFAKRKENVIYQVEHNQDYFYILTNDDESINFKIMRVKEKSYALREMWEELLPHNSSVPIDYLEMFEKFLIIHNRINGIKNISIFDIANNSWQVIENLPEILHTINYHDSPNNNDFFSTVLRFNYSSLVTPSSTYDYDMVTHTLTLLKIDEITNYQKDEYVSTRVFAMSSDGAEIPISILHKKNIILNGSNPTLVYGYGCYGLSTEPGFSASIVSIIERGFIYAIAHVRGGGEYGRQWYLDGKYEKKANSFSDFISCINFLIDNNYTNTSKLAVRGGSAGGLLIGAVLNITANINTAVLNVPFLDALNTMMDTSISLTTLEFFEFGNPIESTNIFNIIKSYSPYDNITKKKYPNILIMANINDSRVPYWEPVKYIARLRFESVPSEKMILLKTNLGAGHSGSSGKYSFFKELSLEYAFIIHTLFFSD